MSLAPSMESKPIREVAYETLKNAIVTGEIPAGSRIVETEYAERMHISRTPLREALRKLERDGLVEYVVRRGVVVRAFTIADVEEIYTIRNALEMLTLPAIVRNATAEDIRSLRALLQEMDAFDETGDIEALSPRARAFHTQLTRLSKMNRLCASLRARISISRAFRRCPSRGKRGGTRRTGSITSWWTWWNSGTWNPLKS